MAIIGGPGGYATIDGPQKNYIGEAMANVENSAFKYREEQNTKSQQQLANDRALKQERDKELQDNLAFDQKYKVSQTGIQSVDSKIHDTSSKIKSTYAEAKKGYDSAKTNEEKNRFYDVMSNSMNALETMKQFPTAYNSATEDLTKGLSEGIYSEASSKRKASELDKFAKGQYVVDTDQRGNIVFSVFDTDENGQLSKVKARDLNAQQMMEYFKPVKDFNIDGTGSGSKKGTSFIKNFQDNIGKPIKETIIKNGKEVTTTFTPGADELAKTMAVEAVQDKDKLYAIFDKLQIDPENSKNYQNPDLIAKAVSYLEDKLKASAPKSVSEKDNYEAENIRLKKESLAETKNNNAQNRGLRREELNKDSVSNRETDAVNRYTGKPIIDPATGKRVKITSQTTTTKVARDKPKENKYSANEINAINLVMKNNKGLSKEQAIQALKDAGKIK